MPKSSLLWTDGEVLDGNDLPEHADGAECRCGGQEFLFYKAVGCPDYHLQCTTCRFTYCMGSEGFGPSSNEGSTNE